MKTLMKWALSAICCTSLDTACMDYKKEALSELNRIQMMAARAVYRIETDNPLMAAAPITAIEVALDNLKHAMKPMTALTASTKDLTKVTDTVSTDKPATGGWEAN